MENTQKWRVLYYISSSGKSPVNEFITSCNEDQKLKILRAINYLVEYGPIRAIPNIKKLSGTPFWEIRILGKDNIRIIYVIEIEKTILVLHGFIKKKQKTPVKEIGICIRRYGEYKLLLTK